MFTNIPVIIGLEDGFGPMVRQNVILRLIQP